MNVIQIPQLPSATSVNGTEALEAVQNGVSVQISTALIAAFAQGQQPTTIATIALLSAFTSRPSIVLVEGFYAADDGGGGLFYWEAGSVTPVVTGMVISPTGSPLGRYKRLWAGALNVLWLGADPNGVLESTAAFAAAALIGGTIVFPPAPGTTAGTYLTKFVNYTVAGTALQGLGNITIADMPNTTSALARFSGASQSMDRLNWLVSQSASTISDCVQILGTQPTGAPFRATHCTITGPTFNPLNINSAPTPITTVGFRVGNTSTAVRQRVFIDDLIVTGFTTGVNMSAVSWVDVNNMHIYDSYASGFALGNNASAEYIKISNSTEDGCGQYGLTLTSQTSAGIVFTPYPYSKIEVLSHSARNCGWVTYLTGINAGSNNPGSGKYGVDYVQSGLQQSYIQVFTDGCALGGMEAKSSWVSGANPTPQGTINNVFDIQCYQRWDFGSGFSYLYSSNNSPVDTLMNNEIRGRAIYTGSPPWTALTPYRRFDMVSNSSRYLLCLGDSTGSANSSGSTAPVGGANEQFTTTSSSAIGTSVLTFAGADLSTVVVGQQVFAGPGTPNGCTVQSVDNVAKTVTVVGTFTVLIPSSRPVIFATLINDGVLNWLDMGAIPTAAKNFQSLDFRSSTNTTVRNFESINAFIGVNLQPQVGADLSIYNATFDGLVVRNATFAGVTQAAGAGGAINMKFLGCQIAGGQRGLHIGRAGGGNFDVDVVGGTYKGLGAQTQLVTTALSSSSTTLTFGGGTTGVNIGDRISGLTGSPSGVFVKTVNATTIITNTAVSVGSGATVTFSSGYGIYIDGSTSTTTLDIDGDPIIEGATAALACNDASGTNTLAINAGSGKFRTITGATAGEVLVINGAGSFIFGPGTSIDNSQPTFAGWITTHGAVAVSGRVVRTDLTTAPTSGGGGTPGNVGEVVKLAAPTATVDGYVCTAFVLNTSATWHAQVLS